MRCAETLAGLAVEVLIKEKRISPRRIVLEARVCSMRWPPAAPVEQKQTQKTALEFRGDLTQVRLFARSGRQFDRQIITEEVVEMPERLDREEVEGKPHWPPPVGVAAEEAGVGVSRFVVEPAGATGEIENQGVVLVAAT